ncbi:hypothetical protein, partial [Chitinophaga sp.]|uniref:hypothetical protein n=1 Tax=Chitinophaga sp. TaxID=1869181 RepID=UPI002F9472FF
HCKMTFTEALITAARRYCIDHHAHWANRYRNERSGQDFPVYTYSDSDYDLFPRYNMLSAILGEIEVLVGNPAVSRETLVQIGLSAGLPFTEDEEHPIETAAIQQEREKFIHFIQTITPEALEQTAPLPHRRRLDATEKEQVDLQLLERWNYDGNYWDPIDPKSPSEVVYLAKRDVTTADYESLRRFIDGHARPYLLEITEEGVITEITPADFNPDSYETAYFDEHYEWIIYGSHELTITFAGEPLLAFIRQLFAGRENLFKYS